MKGPTYELTARKEVILSAGVYGTPQLLLLSGIGEPSELAKSGIQLLVNLPGVGKNMTDQPILFPTWSLGINDTLDA
jgi:choline dehydrogenase-like flavoprotein